ncbi:MAG: 23S rRNA (adenine(2503)-C(2))-methyltransferase RlmN [Clostridia bacterium]|nr:23S rRNA (adenine(2503)-C(2))-methyltransferase RlmN [Clostridia bacterium]
MDEKKPELLSMLPDELEEYMKSIGEPRYRARQLFEQLHRGLRPEEMTNIGKATRARLAETSELHMPTIRKKLVSAIDGTVKYLFELYDGNCVESVVMKYKHGNTVCVSSQVGCRMGCAFCASTIGGRVRDLGAGEILGQVIVAQRDTGERISNIVMMGIGEPLDNYDNVIKFLHLVNHEYGLNIGYRHISLSTCGLVDGIERLRAEDLPITLSISLHAADDETRSRIMPVNKKYGVRALLAACRDYYEATERRISFEYTLISGENDTVEHAERLSQLLNGELRRNGAQHHGGMPIHVNLIPVNEVKERDFVRSDERAIKAFIAVLERRGIRATLRRKLGPDINASCGQLRREAAGQE